MGSQPSRPKRPTPVGLGFFTQNFFKNLIFDLCQLFFQRSRRFTWKKVDLNFVSATPPVLEEMERVENFRHFGDPFQWHSFLALVNATGPKPTSGGGLEGITALQ
eukprot:EG_transcript_45074